MQDNSPLDIKEAAKLLNLKESYIRRQIFINAIPFYKIGALVKFKKEDLWAWFDSKKKNPIELVFNNDTSRA